ncbi:MAG TPA: iron-containing redox enzyme family protein [Kofleriaceae bacterium]|nr:iron-containing redox enzyme family protein [Kofleriaceae bacterium]
MGNQPAAELARPSQDLGAARAPTSQAGSESIAAAAAATFDLARRAYQEGDPEARRRAESVLYLFNKDTFFAPPSDPVAGVVWSTLMQAKLAALREELGAGSAEEIDSRAMETMLLEAVDKWGAFRHPLLDELDRSGSLEAYRIWAKNWFGSCQGFSNQLASLFQRTTDQARRAVLENLADELDGPATHDDLRERFLHSLGLAHSYEAAIEDEDWVLESTELLNLRTGLCNLGDPSAALGCFYTVEANWPAESRRHHAINKARGLGDHTVEYWTTHAFADEQHSDAWLESVKSVCHTAAQRAAVVEGATLQLRLRWKMYDSIHARVVARAA